METRPSIFTFYIGKFPIEINQDIIIQWAVIVILGIAAYLLTRNLNRKPSKRQVVLETIYKYVEGLVSDNMGNSYISYIPYVGTLVVYLLCLNLIGVIGIDPPTSNLSVAAGLGISTFFVVNGTALAKNGVWGYTKAFGQPYAFMIPINIMERVVLPVSLTLRLFGNMYAASLLVGMIYSALAKVNMFAQIGLPIIAHGYFDLFDGTIQMLVFTMLTIINIKMTAEHH